MAGLGKGPRMEQEALMTEKQIRHEKLWSGLCNQPQKRESSSKIRGIALSCFAHLGAMGMDVNKCSKRFRKGSGKASSITQPQHLKV